MSRAKYYMTQKYIQNESFLLKKFNKKVVFKNFRPPITFSIEFFIFLKCKLA
jgi:hypothetical protein